jgi:hypothetical protein
LIPKKAKIFVSYSRRDAGDFAEQIQRHFASFGRYDVFTDVNSINVGDDWGDTIEDNISNCDVFVIMITYGALHSPHVENEVLQAQREKKKIIPCFYRNVIDRDIKWGLSNIQGVEFEDKWELARNLYSKIANLTTSPISSSLAREKDHEENNESVNEQEADKTKSLHTEPSQSMPLSSIKEVHDNITQRGALLSKGSKTMSSTKEKPTSHELQQQSRKDAPDVGRTNLHTDPTLPHYNPELEKKDKDSTASSIHESEARVAPTTPTPATSSQKKEDEEEEEPEDQYRKIIRQRQLGISPKILIPIIAAVAVIGGVIVFSQMNPPPIIQPQGNGTTEGGSDGVSTNNPPVPIDQSVTTTTNTPVGITLKATDQDANESLTAEIVSSPTNGALSPINQDTGVVTYTPNPGFNGTDEFTFRVNDGTADSNSVGTVKIQVS